MRRFGACDRWLLRRSCTHPRLPRGDGTDAPEALEGLAVARLQRVHRDNMQAQLRELVPRALPGSP